MLLAPGGARHRQGLLVQRLRPRGVARGPIEIGQVGQDRSQIGMLRAALATNQVTGLCGQVNGLLEAALAIEVDDLLIQLGELLL